jgi:UDP-N-acetylmuramate dehydrogenase
MDGHDMIQLNATLGAGLRGELRRDLPMARHCTWRAGGCAAYAYRPADLEDLSLFLRSHAELLRVAPPLFVGLGSNLLVRDGGLRATVILLHPGLGGLRLGAVEGERVQVLAQAGVAAPKLARFAANHGLVQAEFLAGIPGTVGGALCMNAGCYGSETWQYVRAVQTMERTGAIRVREPADFAIAYRHVRAHGFALGIEAWFVAAVFEFPRGDGAEARARIKDLLARRVASQPLDQPNAGSVFRNPPGDFAARLIESCGLKGFAIGGARVSEKHANFIVNPGGRGSATDIERLIEHVQVAVEQQRGVRLQAEVRIVGESAGES